MAVSLLLRLTGFTKTSNFVYFSLSALVFAIFCASELRWLSWQTESYTGATGRHPVYAGTGLVFDSPRGPGEGYLYKRAFLRASQQVHLWSVLRELISRLSVGTSSRNAKVKLKTDLSKPSCWHLAAVAIYSSYAKEVCNLTSMVWKIVVRFVNGWQLL